MPVDFTCPNCAARTIVEDQFCGRSGPCFSCNKTVTVPYAPGRSAASEPAPAGAPPAASRRRSLAPTIVLVVAAGLLTSVVSVVLFVSILLPGVQSVRHSAHRQQCRANLLRIGQALQTYHQQHGSFPPAYIADANGKPMHSWRVLILPQLGEGALYQRYDFHQPWNSPQNLAVTARRPDVFGCPADSDATLQNDACYMVVVGPRTAFPPDGGVTRIDQFVDPLSETLLVAEVSQSGVGWTEPLDLDATQLRLAINPAKAGSNAISSEHSGGAHGLFGDGQVHWLTDTLPMETLSAALTRDGREPFDWSQLISE